MENLIVYLKSPIISFLIRSNLIQDRKSLHVRCSCKEYIWQKDLRCRGGIRKDTSGKTGPDILEGICTWKSIKIQIKMLTIKKDTGGTFYWVSSIKSIKLL